MALLIEIVNINQAYLIILFMSLSPTSTHYYKSCNLFLRTKPYKEIYSKLLLLLTMNFSPSILLVFSPSIVWLCNP